MRFPLSNPFFLHAWKSTECSSFSPQIPNDMPGHFEGRPGLGTSHVYCCQGLALQDHIARQEEEAWQGTLSYSDSVRSIKEALGPEGRDVSQYLWLPLQSPPELIDAVCPPEDHWTGNWVHASGWPPATSISWTALLSCSMAGLPHL